MAIRIARASGKDVSATRRFGERAACAAEDAYGWSRRGSSIACLQDDASVKIVSSPSSGLMERMTSLRATFEIPFH
jgi:hypothetical protein